MSRAHVGAELRAASGNGATPGPNARGRALTELKAARHRHAGAYTAWAGHAEAGGPLGPRAGWGCAGRRGEGAERRASRASTTGTGARAGHRATTPAARMGAGECAGAGVLEAPGPPRPGRATAGAGDRVGVPWPARPRRATQGQGPRGREEEGALSWGGRARTAAPRPRVEDRPPRAGRAPRGEGARRSRAGTRGGAGARYVVGRAGPSGAMAGAGAREEGGRGSRRGPRKKKRGRNGEDEGEEGSPRGGRGRRRAAVSRRRASWARETRRVGGRGEKEGEIWGEGRVTGGAYRGRRRRLNRRALHVRGEWGASWARGWAARRGAARLGRQASPRSLGVFLFLFFFLF
jgi:hypothetical protein